MARVIMDMLAIITKCKRGTSLGGRIAFAIQPPYVFWMLWVSDVGEDDRHGFVR
jgi:hypothetical protein